MPLKTLLAVKRYGFWRTTSIFIYIQLYGYTLSYI